MNSEIKNNIRPIKITNYAVLVLIFRDILGYLLIGAVFLILIITLYPMHNIIGENSSELINVFIVVSLGYPTGRLLWQIGNLLINRNKNWQFNRIYQSQFVKIQEKLNLSEIKILGNKVSENNIRMLIAQLASRVVYIQKPDFYFLFNMRSNNLRLLAESVIGFTIAGVIILIYSIDTFSLDSIVILFIGLAIIFLSVYTAVKQRKAHARDEIFSALIILTDLSDRELHKK